MPGKCGPSPGGSTVSGTRNRCSPFIDAKRFKVLAKISTSSKPDIIALSPDETEAYVTTRVSNVVDVIDLKKRKVVKSNRAGKDPHGIVIKP